MFANSIATILKINEKKMDIEAAKQTANYNKRHIAFEGALNFRDLGNLPTSKGTLTKSGRLFRSGRLGNLTNNDQSRFCELGLRYAFDFRLPFERENYPNPPASTLGLEMLGVGYLPDGALAMFDAINDGTISADDVLAGMTNQYVLMATAHMDVLGDLFRSLLKPDATPMLFHCSGGKDRTGVASAMLLRIAGVAREVVIADYLLTNLDVPPLGVLQGNVSEELVAVVGFAHTELIEAAMDAVENEYETYEEYVRRGAGLSSAEYERLVNILSE